MSECPGCPSVQLCQTVGCRRSAPSSPSPDAGSETRCPGCGGRGYRTGRQGRYNCPRCRGDGMVSSPASERRGEPRIATLAEHLGDFAPLYRWVIGDPRTLPPVVCESVEKVHAHYRRLRSTGEPRCPCCGSTKIAPTEGNAVGSDTDCLNCGHDFVRSTGEPSPDLAAMLDDMIGKVPLVRHDSRGATFEHPHGEPGLRKARARVEQYVASLQAEQERAARDAERYRFLRGNPLVLDQINGAAIGTVTFDRMTDEAMASRRHPDART